MAQSIPLEVAPRNAHEELRKRLEQAPDDHAEAILSALDLLQEMHNQGLLDIAHGVLSTRDEILGTLARDASTPEAIRAIRNLLFLRRVFGSIDPDRFQSIFQAIPDGFARATAQPRKRATIFSLLRRFTSKESLRAMAGGLDFLQSLGSRLLAEDKTAPREAAES